MTSPQPVGSDIEILSKYIESVTVHEVSGLPSEEAPLRQYPSCGFLSRQVGLQCSNCHIELEEVDPEEEATTTLNRGSKAPVISWDCRDELFPEAIVEAGGDEPMRDRIPTPDDEEEIEEPPPAGPPPAVPVGGAVTHTPAQGSLPPASQPASGGQGEHQQQHTETRSLILVGLGSAPRTLIQSSAAFMRSTWPGKRGPAQALVRQRK